MERVLKPFCSDNVRMSMEQDPPTPLLSAVQKRPGPTRRRTRSTGSLRELSSYSWSNKHSGDSSSSVGEWDFSREIGMSSLHQSDSDDVSGIQGKSTFYNLQSHHRLPYLFPNIESDSVNENFSPVRPTTRSRPRGLFKVLRRKRKLKRMAMEMSTASTSSRAANAYSSIGKKKRILRHTPNCENKFCVGLNIGKRKRSTRSITDPPQRTVLALHRLSLRDDTQHPHSSSSLSSSESDTGIYTNDEGREGDDEQSDWVGEARGVWDDSDRGEGMDDDQPFSLPIVGRRGREIRGGRRRVRSDKASFTVLTSANEKLSRFLQDPAKSQLRLHPMKEHERHQLSHLANLYSLDMQLAEHHQHRGLTCPILTKTSNTVRGEPVNMTRLSSLSDIKRRRRTPPNVHTVTTDVEMGESGDSMVTSLFGSGSISPIICKERHHDQNSRLDHK
ncbi:G patch domain-containing protein 2-like isoform X1 [Cimex lectularius]|uniref:Uncharacterized protein n=1 Tax=Cimex lectularius TaxID=79782 RepID=A0A8I6SAB1_CIMLE|nr:G patch domain-containing protein 2-like isoform X1 [Cimex lectularius]